MRARNIALSAQRCGTSRDRTFSSTASPVAQRGCAGSRFVGYGEENGWVRGFSVEWGGVGTVWIKWFGTY